MLPHTIEHEPPQGTPVMHQDWCDILFLHWAFPAETVRRLLPQGLSLDLFDGQAYVGLTPFSLRNLRLTGMPPVPYLSHFLECNLRTYVVGPDGVPGIWFFSLEAERKLAVLGARVLNLPYFHAEMEYLREGDNYRYVSQRDHGGEDAPGLSVRWKVGQELPASQPGELAWFLVERYCLYARRGEQGLHSICIHHPPWILREARLEQCEQSLSLWAGLPTPSSPVSTLFSRGVSTAIWPPHQVVG
jgi:uncharacterized protein YqjF (DUF2071 family)